MYKKSVLEALLEGINRMSTKVHIVNENDNDCKWNVDYEYYAKHDCNVKNFKLSKIPIKTLKRKAETGSASNPWLFNGIVFSSEDESSETQA